MTDKDLIESLMDHIHIPDVVMARRRIQKLLSEADSHQQALDVAREEGRRAGLEEAANWVENAAVTETWEWPEIIRALIDNPGDPVAEAARVLADHMKERRWQYYPIEMPLTKDGQGPATLGDDAVSVSYEVWEAGTLRAVSSHECLPDAIEAALRALAQKEEGQ